MLPLCLVVSADSSYASELQANLKSHGLKLYAAGDLATTRPILGQWRFDAVLCDGDGGAAESLHATVRWLRREQRAPIVVLATPGRADTPVAALEAGATEIIDKDTSPRLIALKLQRLMELAASPGEAERCAVSLGELRLDPRREEAVYGDRPLALTGGEFELLLLLASRSDGFVHRVTIMRTLGRAGAAGEPRRGADMHVCRIRRKLREAGASSLTLETIHGQGYALRLRDDPASAGAGGFWRNRPAAERLGRRRINGRMTIEGSCLCGAVRWRFEGLPESATACNCTACRRYGTLWAYDYEGEGIHVWGPATAYVRGKALELPLLRRPAAASPIWRALKTERRGAAPHRRQPAPGRARGGGPDSDRPLRRPRNFRRPGAGRAMRRRLLVLT